MLHKYLFVAFMFIVFSASCQDVNKKMVTTTELTDNPYFNLLQEWCDGMLNYQVNQNMGPGIEGGLMCSACSRIHGRCFDAVYPLMTMADLTGEQKYLEGAIKLQAWADHVVRPDGSWGNDPIITTWNYTTVFSVIALGEAIRYHGHLLDADTLKDWIGQLRRASDWVYDHLAFNNKPVINYPVSAAGALAVAGEVLKDKKFTKRARELAHEAITYFSEDNHLLYGEGIPYRGITANGSRPIDVGYNVEESIPNLLLYAEITCDSEVKNILVKALKSHLEFMLPDGAWDNSWGSRNYKWTYWGSRTSDGCQAGYGILGDKYPEFAEASLRNLELLKATTHNGILYGGPHYVDRGILPCMHHTFCHAKALATVLNSGAKVPQERIKLPRESSDGVQEFMEIRTWLAAKGAWKSTFTINDWVTEDYNVANASGGAMTLLWHEKIGPVLASCLIGVTNREPTNIQMNFDTVQMSPTPMLKMEINSDIYYSVKDFNAQIGYKNTNDYLLVTVKGKLVNKNQEESKETQVAYQFDYRFTKEALEISLKTSVKGKPFPLEYILPIISKGDETFKIEGNNIVIQKPNGNLSVNANNPPTLYKNQKRVFNTEPGFEVIPLVYHLDANQEFKTKLIVE